MLMSVGTRARPRAGMTVSLALYRSWPAAYTLPLVGALAESLSSRTWSCCSALAAAATEGAIGAGGCKAAMFASGVGVAAPESIPRGRVDVWESGVGSMTLVRLGSGELGSEGGSWVGSGVAVSSALDIVVVVSPEGGEGWV